MSDVKSAENIDFIELTEDKVKGIIERTRDFRHEVEQYGNVQSTGSYAEDCAQGRALATALVRRTRDPSAPKLLFSAVCHRIAETEGCNGIRIGFFHRIGDHLR